jgi:hypothetical protein
MGQDNLPQYIKDQIRNEADALAKRFPGHDGVYIGKRNGIEIGYTAAGDKYARQIAALQAKCERYEKALKWYADEGNYFGDNGELATAWKNKMGLKANEALSGEGEKEVENG